MPRVRFTRNAAPIPVAEHPLTGTQRISGSTESRDQASLTPGISSSPSMLAKGTFPGTGTSDPRLSPRRKTGGEHLQSRTGHRRTGHGVGPRILRPLHRTNPLVSLDASRLTRKLSLDWGPKSVLAPSAYLVGLKRSDKRGSLGRNA